MPGTILIFGLYTQKYFPEYYIQEFMKINQSGQWILTILISYVLGHAMLSLHKILNSIVGKPLWGVNTLLTKHKWDSKSIEERISNSAEYINFLNIIVKKIDGKGKANIDFTLNYNNLRSMAMTVSQQGGETATRFRFISLFCYGVSMAILILAVIGLANDFTFTMLAIYIGAYLAFYFRGQDFEFRTANVPFPIALTELLFEKKYEDKDK